MNLFSFVCESFALTKVTSAAIAVYNTDHVLHLVDSKDKKVSRFQCFKNEKLTL